MVVRDVSDAGSMKPSAIYLKAAKSIARRDRPSCLAIADAGYGEDRGPYDSYPEVLRYSDLFAPTHPILSTAWLEGYVSDDKERQNWRVLALLFMYQIAIEDEHDHAS
jgi:hypothetical protein